MSIDDLEIVFIQITLITSALLILLALSVSSSGPENGSCSRSRSHIKGRNFQAQIIHEFIITQKPAPAKNKSRNRGIPFSNVKK